MFDQFAKENEKKKERFFVCIQIAKRMHNQCTKENVLSRVYVASTQNICLQAGLFLRRAKHLRVSKETHIVSKETRRVSKET